MHTSESAGFRADSDVCGNCLIRSVFSGSYVPVAFGGFFILTGFDFVRSVFGCCAGTAMDAELAALVADDGVLADRAGDEDVSADDGTFSNDGFAAQDRGAGVDRDVVADRGMTL